MRPRAETWLTSEACRGGHLVHKYRQIFLSFSLSDHNLIYKISITLLNNLIDPSKIVPLTFKAKYIYHPQENHYVNTMKTVRKIYYFYQVPML